MTVLDHKIEIEQTKMTYLEVLIETKLKKVQKNTNQVISKEIFQLAI